MFKLVSLRNRVGHGSLDVCSRVCTGMARNLASLPTKSWNFFQPVVTTGKGNVKDATLIVLNQPLINRGFVEKLWHLAAYHVCADGGSNQLYDGFAGERHRFIPELILGDLDSAREDVLTYYTDQGTQRLKVWDQDKHDMTKCIDHISTRASTKDTKQTVYVIGGLDGRFDHTIANINALFYVHQHYPNIDIVLLSDKSAVWLLEPQVQHLLNISTLEGPTCGYVPIGGAVRAVTTTGLKWDVQDQPFAFGGLISTSNSCENVKEVSVITSEPLVWTVELQLTDLHLTTDRT
eukprot:m.32059 g.32059  ORF g.32059 m.32059 type:complete len:292 (-) comp16572_c1_seq1:44-919(-)